MTKTIPTVLSTSQPERDDTTCYLERSKVREILIGHNAATQAVLSKIDALPIFVAEDFRAQCAPKPTAWRWRPRGSTNWIYDPTDEWRLDNQDNIEFEPLYAALAATPAVGGEALNFPYQRTFDAICAAVKSDKTPPFAIHVSVKTFQEAFNNHRDAAAQPASPLRGREDLRNALEFGIWSVSGPTNDAEEKMLEEQIEASWQDFEKQTDSASPPEQPAADQVTEREELIEQCAKIAEPWSGFIDADKMGAADNAVIKVRNDIAAAIRSLKETQA